MINPKISRTKLSIALFLPWLATMTQFILATGLFYYAHEDGSVRGVDQVLGGDAGLVIPASSFFGTPPNPATGRNIAFDPYTNLLWYAASDNHVHSLDVTTFASGPIINDINDGFYGAMRTLAIDRNGRRLYIANSLGEVLVYNLVTNSWMYTIPTISFGVSEPNPGNRRHLAVDDWGYLWYAAADGSFREFNPVQANPHYTGRAIPPSAQYGNNPGSERYFVAVRWPSGSHYLYYAASDSSLRTFDLDSLNPVDIFYFPSSFLGSSSPGALRSFSLDPNWTPSGTAPAAPTGITASRGTYPDRVRVSWDPTSNADAFGMYRREVGQPNWQLWNTGWIEIDPTTQRPYTDDPVPMPGVQYEYQVFLSNLWGQSPLSTVTVGWSSQSGLTPPTGVSASMGTFSDRVRITWNPVPGTYKYEITRADQGGRNPVPIGTATNTQFDDMGPTLPNTPYVYRVAACDTSYCSNPSAEATGWRENSLDPALAMVLDHWQTSELCDDPVADILSFVRYQFNGYTCP